MAKRLIVALFVLALGGALVWRIFFASDAGASAAPPEMGPMPVSVAAVIAREVTEYREFSGRFAAVDQAEIRPRVDGTIEAIHFEPGAIVKKGDLLFTIDARPFEAALKRAEADLAAARTQADYTQKDYDRVAALVKDDFVAKRDYDARRNSASTAQAAVTSAEAALRTAKLNLDYTQIRAPITGRISRAEITVGNLVQSVPTAPLLTTIVSSSPIYVDFAMDESTYLGYVRAGATGNDKAREIPIFVGLAGDAKATHQGVIRTFDNKIDPASGTLRVRAELDNADGALVPGMYALVRMAVPHQGKSLLVADRAIGTDQNKKFVYAVGVDNIVAVRPVMLGGLVEGGLRIITSGIEEGDKIVVNGLQRARPGAPVAPTAISMDDATKEPAPAAHP